MVLDPRLGDILMDPVAVAGISAGIGMVSLASVWALSLFKSPKEVGQELAQAVDSLRRELSQQKDDHHDLAESNAVLANEVKHLGESVRTLAGELKSMRDMGYSPQKTPGRRGG